MQVDTSINPNLASKRDYIVQQHNQTPQPRAHFLRFTGYIRLKAIPNGHIHQCIFFLICISAYCFLWLCGIMISSCLTLFSMHYHRGTSFGTAFVNWVRFVKAIKNNETAVLAAVQQNGMSLQFASEEMKNNETEVFEYQNVCRSVVLWARAVVGCCTQGKFRPCKMIHPEEL